MTSKKISELTSMPALADVDLSVGVDVTDTTTKKMTLGQVKDFVQTLRRTAVANSNYVLIDTDELVAFTSISAPRIVSLPTAVGRAGRVFEVHDESGDVDTTKTITIDPFGSETIEGMSSLVLATAHGSVRFYSNGVSWHVLRDLPMYDPTVVELWVDPVAGDDSALGTAGAPLKTIQKAIDRLCPPGVTPREIARGDTLTVHVMYTSGMPAITDNVVLPPRKGNGVFIIEGEEEVLATVEFTSFTPLAAFEVRQQINLVGSLSAAADDGSFLRKAVPLADPMVDLYENLPVVNGTSAHVVVADPGFYTAISYTAGDDLEQVRPRITWASTVDDDGVNYVPGSPTVLNFGGNLIIRGFRIQPDDSVTSVGFARFLEDRNVGSLSWVSSSHIVRCILTSNTFFVGFDTIVSGCVSLGGVIGLASPGEFRSCVGVLYNVRWIIDVDNAWPFLSFDSSNMTAGGLDLQGVGTAQYPIIYLLNTKMEGCYADLRNASIFVAGYSYLMFYALTVENSPFPSAVIRIGAPTNYASNRFCDVNMIDGSRIRGSTGNSGVGVLVGAFGFLASTSGTPTLSCSAGDVKVGDLAPVTWASGSLTDSTVLARYKVGTP